MAHETDDAVTTETASFHDILKDLLNFNDEDHPILKALDKAAISSINDFQEFLDLTMIAVLDYPTGTARHPSKETLAVGHYRLLQLLYLHVKECYLLNGSYNYSSVNSRQDFINFRNQDDIRSNAWIHDVGKPHELRIVNYTVPPQMNQPAPAPIGTVPRTTSPSSGSAVSSITARSAADDFRRTIKRDKSHYDALAKEEDWDTWQNSFIIQAQAHGLENILDHTYQPTTADEKDLFREQSKFMLSVFRDKIKTDDGRMIVRAHTATLDAQGIYKELCEFHSQSISAKLSAHELVKHLSSAQYDKHWACTSKKFILHWLNTARRYNDMVSPTEQFGEHLLITFLKQAVYNIPELRRVETSQEILESGGVNVVGLTKYKSLLLAAATRYDSTNRSKSSPSASKRLINSVSNETQCSIDMPVTEFVAVNQTLNHVTEVDANIANQQKHRPYPEKTVRAWVPTEIYRNLTDEQRKMIQEHNKKLGFGLNNPQKSQRQRVHQHETIIEEDTEPIEEVHDEEQEEEPEDHFDNDQTLLAHAAGQVQLDDDDIRHIMSCSRQVNQHITYHVSKINSRTNKNGSLMDRGANGGVAGDNVRILGTHKHKTVRIVGVGDHETPDLKMVKAAGLVQAKEGPIVVIMNQYAHLGRGKTIHSAGQWEMFENQVNDKSVHVPGGTQTIVTLEGYHIPLQMRQGLPYIDMVPPSDKDMQDYPKVIVTSEEWNPNVLDHEIEVNDNTWGSNDVYYDSHSFDDHGNYIDRHVTQSIFDASKESAAFYDAQEIAINSMHLEEKEPDYESYRPKLGWAPFEVVKRTFKSTTQLASAMFNGGTFQQHFKTRFPALNCPRRPEPVATDYIHVGVPAVGNGSTGAQIFVGTETHVLDVAGVKSNKEFVHTLEDHIRTRGAMDTLVSDSAKNEISRKVKDILRAYRINDWQSEPHHQNQNPCERHYQTAKRYTNVILDRTGAPATCWLLALSYVCLLLNHLASSSLGWRTPLECLHGVTPDISPFLQFEFYEPVYYRKGGHTSFTDTKEGFGYFVGIAENVGHALTYKILDAHSNVIIHRSEVRSARPDMTRNRRLEPEKGETGPRFKPILQRTRHDSPDSRRDKAIVKNKLEEAPQRKSLPRYSTEDLIGRSFLLKENQNGTKPRGRIKRVVTNKEDDQLEDNEGIQFLVEVEGQNVDEILSYNEVLDYLNQQYGGVNQEWGHEDGNFKFRSILKHSEPLKKGDKHYNGSKYNVLVLWETGEQTWEPLSIIGADDPVTCAMYARDHNLLQTPGWKQFRRIARREKVMERLIHQTRLKQFRRAPKYKFGVQIPYDYAEAKRLDELNGNNKWQEATDQEIGLLHEYRTFIDKGKVQYDKHRRVTNVPKGYKQIRGRFVYDCKHDGRHRGRYVAGGHLTEVPLESVYSGVVSIEHVRLVVFLAELNQMELWGTDISSAYLCAETKEKLFIIAGPEFGALHNHVLIIFKAQYGLRTSGARWHDRLFDILKACGFTPSKINNVWMRKKKCKDGFHKWEYVATYVDDLLLAMEDPNELIKMLEAKPFLLKLKGSGPLDYHLGCNFERDPEDKTIKWVPRKYIDRMMDMYKRHFDEEPSIPKKERGVPLVGGDHPELDESPLLGPEDIRKYQSLIGALQWLITLGRFDINVHVMTMSRFAQAPRQGHLDRVKRIFAYVKHSKEYAIRVRTGKPDYSKISQVEYDWEHTVYGKGKEEIPPNSPEPLGKPVVLTHFVDGNLEHCKLTGRAVTGVIDMINQTPIGWYAKRQNTIETASYGSEVVSARIAADRALALRTTLRYLGVPIEGKSLMFGDNQSVVNCAMPHSQLSKRHHALNWHRVREMIASGIIHFKHIDGKKNPADILSKHYTYPDASTHLKTLFNWSGDTSYVDYGQAHSKGGVTEV